MNSQQAKEILLLYRPEAANAADPEFTEALELTQADAELGAWFKQHCEVQLLLRQRFQQIPVPDGLKQQIISERRPPISAPVHRSRAALWATVAVIIAMFFGMASLYYNSQKTNQFGEFRDRMARIVLREYPKMDLETSDLNRIRSFFVQKQVHPDFALPAGLSQAKGTGCAVLDWRGQKVSMICFDSGQKADPNDSSDLFLFVVDQGAVPKAPARKPKYSQMNRLATLSWTAKGKTYILGGFGDESFIRRYL